MIKKQEGSSTDEQRHWSYAFEHDRLLTRDYEGPKVLVSFAVSSHPLPEFHNVILNTGMPRTNEDLDRVRMGMANYILKRSQFDYEKPAKRLLDMFIIAIKEV
jgi:hypothetical protein